MRTVDGHCRGLCVRLGIAAPPEIDYDYSDSSLVCISLSCAVCWVPCFKCILLRSRLMTKVGQRRATARTGSRQVQGRWRMTFSQLKWIRCSHRTGHGRTHQWMEIQVRKKRRMTSRWRRTVRDLQMDVEIQESSQAITGEPERCLATPVTTCIEGPETPVRGDIATGHDSHSVDRGVTPQPQPEADQVEHASTETIIRGATPQLSDLGANPLTGATSCVDSSTLSLTSAISRNQLLW